MNVNKTRSIFHMAVSESELDASDFGLRLSVYGRMIGYAGICAKTKDEYIAEVDAFATGFIEMVEREIKDIEESLENGSLDYSNGDEGDLESLNKMLSWTYDEAELARLASEDWDENNGE